jgi:exodeoxyribonuclease III
MKLVSWNINGRVAKASAQCGALASREPDIVALQEVTTRTCPILRSGLKSHGLPFAVDSFGLAPSTSELTGPRRYGLLIASRFPVGAVAGVRFAVPWPKRILAATIAGPGCQLELYTTHIPPGSTNYWIKVEMLEGLYAALASTPRGPRILCGDFNTPQLERPNGEIVTWAQGMDEQGRVVLWERFRGGSGARWDAAERNVLEGLARFDLADVYRSLHGYVVYDCSWYLRRKGTVVGRRFDHVFAAACLRPMRCEYLHAFREAALSDHSPMEVVFAG